MIRPNPLGSSAIASRILSSAGRGGIQIPAPTNDCLGWRWKYNPALPASASPPTRWSAALCRNQHAACVLYGDLSLEKRMSRLIRNMDRFGSPVSSRAKRANRTSISSISARIGARICVSYSPRCASNHGFLLLRARSRRNRSEFVVNGIVIGKVSPLLPSRTGISLQISYVGGPGWATSASRAIGTKSTPLLLESQDEIPSLSFDDRFNRPSPGARRTGKGCRGRPGVEKPSRRWAARHAPAVLWHSDRRRGGDARGQVQLSSHPGADEFRADPGASRQRGERRPLWQGGRHGGPEARRGRHHGHEGAARRAAQGDVPVL